MSFFDRLINKITDHDCPACGHRLHESCTDQLKCPRCQANLVPLSLNSSNKKNEDKKQQQQKRYTLIGLLIFSLLAFFLIAISQQSVYAAKKKLPKIVLYSASWCGYCTKTRKFFKRFKIPFTEKDITKSVKANQEYRKLGGGGIPLIIIGKRYKLTGYNPSLLFKMLKKTGYKIN